MLLDNWKKAYFSIPKNNSCVLDVSTKVKPKELKDLLAYSGLINYGYDKYISFVNSLEDKELIGRVQAGRAREDAKKLLENNQITESNHLNFELDSRVLDIATRA